jgi:hypothetical protein
MGTVGRYVFYRQAAREALEVEKGGKSSSRKRSQEMYRKMGKVTVTSLMS